MKRNIGKLIVLTGFSGSGKDTLMNLVLQKRPDINRVVTHTTRPKRKGEKEGLDYHFVSKVIFKKMITGDQLIEHVLYGSHYKGTSKSEFNKVLGGKSIFWRIDMSAAATVEETLLYRLGRNMGSSMVKRTTKLLIKTSSPKVALNRYKAREKDKASLEEFKKRLDRDTKLWQKHRSKYPNVIINKTGKQHQAVDEMLQIIDN